MAPRVTKPRPVVVVKDQPAVVAPTVKPEETVMPENNTAAEVPAATSAVPTTVVENPPADVNQPDNSAPVAVPATPAPKSEAQIAAEAWGATLKDSFLSFYKQRPNAVDAVLIDTADRAAMKKIAQELMAGDDTLDAFDAMAMALTNAAEHNARVTAAMQSGHATDIHWLWAAENEARKLHETIRAALENKGVQFKPVKTVKPPTERAAKADAATQSTGKGKANWAEKAPRLIKVAADIGLDQFVLVDKTRGGYEFSERGTVRYHAVKLHADGRWERVDYDATTHAVKPLGIFVDSPIWFTVEHPAADKPELLGTKPKYTAEGMFFVLMHDSTGKLISAEGFNEDKKPDYATLTAFYTSIK